MAPERFSASLGKTKQKSFGRMLGQRYAKGWVKGRREGSNARVGNGGVPRRSMPTFADAPSPLREWLRAADAATAARGHSTQAPREVHPTHSFGGGGEVRGGEGVGVGMGFSIVNVFRTLPSCKHLCKGNVTDPWFSAHQGIHRRFNLCTLLY